MSATRGTDSFIQGRAENTGITVQISPPPTICPLKKALIQTFPDCRPLALRLVTIATLALIRGEPTFQS